MAKQLNLAARLDTAASADLRNEILACESEDLVFDGSAVEQLGGQCLELLMSVGVLWKAAGHAVSLEDPSPQMIDDLARFGLDPDTVLEGTA